MSGMLRTKTFRVTFPGGFSLDESESTTEDFEGGKFEIEEGTLKILDENVCLIHAFSPGSWERVDRVYDE